MTTKKNDEEARQAAESARIRAAVEAKAGPLACPRCGPAAEVFVLPNLLRLTGDVLDAFVGPSGLTVQVALTVCTGCMRVDLFAAKPCGLVPADPIAAAVDAFFARRAAGGNADE
jgi:hypothetical protein